MSISESFAAAPIGSFPIGAETGSFVAKGWAATCG